MIRKKMILLPLAIGMIIASLIGCGKSSSKTEAAPKVMFWGDKFHDAETSNNVIDAWGIKSDTEIELNNFIDTAAFQAALSQAIDTESTPDIITWWSGEQLETLVTSGKIQPLDDVWETITKMGVSSDIKEAFVYDGKAYAVPYSVLNNVIFYNVGAFEKAGVEKKPTTFDEFLDACDKLLAAGITPIGLKNDSWASFIWFQALVAAKNPQLYLDISNGTKKYTDPEMVEVMEIWQSMIEKGYFADPIATADVNKELALGAIAFLFEPHTLIMGIERDYGVLPGEDIDVFVMPSMDTAQKGVIFFETTPLALTTKANNPKAAKKVLVDYFSTDVQTVIAKEWGIAILEEATMENAIINQIATMASSDEYQSILRFYENTPSQLRDVAINELAKFMAEQQDIKTTLNIIQKKADEIFAQ